MKSLSPGSTIGVFGSGQLGRMFAMAAQRMGYRAHSFSPYSDTPAGQVADMDTVAAYEDLAAVAKFAAGVDVITFEFENVPAATVEAAEALSPAHPRGEILHIAQNRLREKTFLVQNGLPVTPFRHITTLDELTAAAADLGFPSILKTAGFGYDGKGQTQLQSADDAESAFERLGGSEAVLEAFVDFDKEVSVVCSRDSHGNFVYYGVIENEHANHILDVSSAPADISGAAFTDAVEMARTIAETLDYVGTLCVEFFLSGDKLIINELAPRPHNSGHLTIDACITSQFEQHVRAVCGLPLGSTEFFQPAAMANLLGDLWANGEPNWPAIVSGDRVKLHLYGKTNPRPGRKMGHLTALAESRDRALAAVRNCRRGCVSTDFGIG